MLAAVVVAASVYGWSIPEEYYLAWQQYEDGDITYEQAVEQYWVCRMLVTVGVPAVVGVFVAGVLWMARPGDLRCWRPNKPRPEREA